MFEHLDYYYFFIFFIAYSFLGWLSEVIFHIFSVKKLINRGFLYGPICPIYGSGAVVMILCLTPLIDNTIYLFIGGFILATVLEYITGYVLELAFDTKWWDYTDEKFNIKGYVCLKFSLLWGLVAVFMMRVLQPKIAQTTYSIPNFALEPLYHALLIIFVIDATLTINSLIEFRTILSELRLIKEELDERIKVRDSLLRQRIDRVAIRIKNHHMSLIESYPNLISGKLEHVINDIRNKRRKK